MTRLGKSVFQETGLGFELEFVKAILMKLAKVWLNKSDIAILVIASPNAINVRVRMEDIVVTVCICRGFIIVIAKTGGLESIVIMVSVYKYL